MNSIYVLNSIPVPITITHISADQVDYVDPQFTSIPIGTLLEVTHDMECYNMMSATGTKLTSIPRGYKGFLVANLPSDLTMLVNFGIDIGFFHVMKKYLKVAE